MLKKFETEFKKMHSNQNIKRLFEVLESMGIECGIIIKSRLTGKRNN